MNNVFFLIFSFAFWHLVKFFCSFFWKERRRREEEEEEEEEGNEF